jgi:hypothetical protein
VLVLVVVEECFVLVDEERLVLVELVVVARTDEEDERVELVLDGFVLEVEEDLLEERLLLEDDDDLVDEVLTLEDESVDELERLVLLVDEEVVIDELLEVPRL